MYDHNKSKVSNSGRVYQKIGTPFIRHNIRQIVELDQTIHILVENNIYRMERIGQEHKHAVLRIVTKSNGLVQLSGCAGYCYHWWRCNA